MGYWRAEPVEYVNEVLTMHIGLEYILVNISMFLLKQRLAKYLILPATIRPAEISISI